MTNLKAVGVPPDLVPVFQAAEEIIKGFFDTIRPYPEKGRIEIGGTRFMWAQARGMALAFRETIADIYGEKGAEQILYKFGHSLGSHEAGAFIERFPSEGSGGEACRGPDLFCLYRLGVCRITPVQQACAGRKLHFYLQPSGILRGRSLYRDKKKAGHPICFINAGYSSGWSGESFGLPLEAREVTCQAQGDEHCTFVLTHRNKMLDRLDKFRELLKTKKRSEITYEDLL